MSGGSIRRHHCWIFSFVSDSGPQFWPVLLAELLTEIALPPFSFLKELVKMWWQNKSYHCDSRIVISESIPGHSFRTIPQHYLEVDWLLVKDITNQFVHSWDDNAISLKYKWAPFTFSVHSKKKKKTITILLSLLKWIPLEAINPLKEKWFLGTKAMCLRIWTFLMPKTWKKSPERTPN